MGNFCLGAFAFSIVVLILTIDQQRNFVEAQSPCRLPADPGFCYAYIPSYYYDFRTGRCQEFIYGGCGGNSNRFANINDCERLRRKCATEGGQRQRG